MRKITARRIVRLAFVLAAGVALCSCAAPRKMAGQGSGYVVPLNQGVRQIVFTDMEKDVVRQVNDLRANPKQWAAYLKNLGPVKGRLILSRQDGKRIDADAAAERIEESVSFLEGASALPPFRVSSGLSLAARDLLKDHGPKGLTGHRASDGSTPENRIMRYGQWEGKSAENVIYGYKDADSLLVGLLIEGGSQGWDQRRNVFDRNLNLIGIACGAHKVYGAMCVIDFAEKYAEMP